MIPKIDFNEFYKFRTDNPHEFTELIMLNYLCNNKEISDIIKRTDFLTTNKQFPGMVIYFLGEDYYNKSSLVIIPDYSEILHPDYKKFFSAYEIFLKIQCKNCQEYWDETCKWNDNIIQDIKQIQGDRYGSK